MAWVRKLPSGKYQGQYRDPHDRVRSTGTYLRKSDAKTEADEQERRVRRSEWTDPELGRESVAAWAAHYLKTTLNQRESTRVRDESYVRNHILPTFGALALAEVEPTNVRTWVEGLSQTHAPATVAKSYQLLARIFAAAEDCGYVRRSPCRGVTLPRVERQEMRFLSAAEIEHLANGVPARHRALVLTCGYLGLRWGEAAGLKRQRLNLLKGTLEVAEILTEVQGRLAFGPPKTSSSRRTLSVPPFLVEVLAEHLEAHTTHPELVFSGRDGGPLRRSTFRRRVWLPAIERAGLAPLRFHDLRHSAASLLIAANVHPKIIQTRLGHSSITVTLDVYGHVLPRLDEAVSTALEDTRREASAEGPAAHLLHAASD